MSRLDLGLERANRSRRVTWLSLVGLVLVPVIVAAGFLWAIWGSGDRLDRVQAAVVNLDEGVEIDGQQVPLGRQLVGGLVDSEEENFTWNLSDAEDAQDGLASGRYAAVITIPENFSEAATSFGAEAADAEQATIDIQTSQVTGIADGALGQTIGQVAVRTVNTELTETYLDNIYLGFNDLAEQFSTVADGAGDLADGAEGLSDGLGQTDDGIAELADGMGRLGDSGGELADGVEQLADGSSRLASGGAELSEGASGLADGVGALDAGVPALASGAEQLADGTATYADGIDAYTAGVDQAAAGVSELNDGLQQGLGGAELSGPSEEELEQLTGGAQQLSDGVSGFAGGLQRYEGSLQELASPSTPCPTQVPADQCAGFKAGVGAALQGLQTQDPNTGQSLGDGIDALATGAEEFSAGIDQLGTQLGGLSGLGDQITQLVEGVDQLDSGLSTLSENGEQLRTGADGLATGASGLSSGIDQLGDGIGQLDAGATQLSSGVAQYTDGVGELSSGINALAPGVRLYTDGVSQTADGVAELSTGFGELAEGGAKLADGNRELADGLAEGATKIPTYDASERENLSTVVAEPVVADGAADLLPEAGSTSLLMVLALWLGALATFLVVQAVSASTWMSSRPSWQLALLSMTPGAAVAAVQAVALTVVGQVVLDLAPVRTAQLLALLLLIGFAFVGINHALAAWLGGVGRILSVTAVVLTAAGAIISAVPALFDTVRPLLPLTPALDAVRALLTDGTGLGGQVGMVMVWLLLAICASVLAVIRRRSVKPATLLRTQPA